MIGNIETELAPAFVAGRFKIRYPYKFHALGMHIWRNFGQKFAARHHIFIYPVEAVQIEIFETFSFETIYKSVGKPAYCGLAVGTIIEIELPAVHFAPVGLSAYRHHEREHHFVVKTGLAESLLLG